MGMEYKGKEKRRLQINAAGHSGCIVSLVGLRQKRMSRNEEGGSQSTALTSHFTFIFKKIFVFCLAFNSLASHLAVSFSFMLHASRIGLGDIQYVVLYGRSYPFFSTAILCSHREYLQTNIRNTGGSGSKNTSSSPLSSSRFSAVV